MLKYKNSVIKIINSSVVDLPTPSSISYFWNFGSLLGLCLVIQLITGIFLAMHYTSHIQNSFDSIHHILRDVNYGWLLKHLHTNGASLFFICIYIHIGRGLYYGSYKNVKLWFSGIIIIFLVMMTAFIGYVLPWGQMSFWGATVITNFITAIPYVGQYIVEWIWGGYSVNHPTLNRFFSLHYLLPFVLTGAILLHLLLLHEKGSNNPLGLNSYTDRLAFHPYFTWKDALGFILLIMFFFYIVFYIPLVLGDPENYIRANSLVTPTHIMPEWYFLFAYAILRAIPNKLGGVIALVLSIVVLIVLPFTHTSYSRSHLYKINYQILYWLFIVLFVLLTWIGSKPVEPPYISLSQLFTFLYFLYFSIKKN